MRNFDFEKRGIPSPHNFETGLETLIRIYAFDYDKEYFLEAVHPTLGDPVYDPPLCEVRIRIMQLRAEISLHGTRYFYESSLPTFIPFDVRTESLEDSMLVMKARQEKVFKYNQSRLHIEKGFGLDTIFDVADSFRRNDRECKK